MLIERNTLIHRLRLGRKIVGFAVSRMAADEAEILSIAIDAGQRGRGLSRNLLLTHLGHLAGRGIRTIFLEVEETTSRRDGYMNGPDFGVVGGASAIPAGGGEQLNALLMRATCRNIRACRTARYALQRCLQGLKTMTALKSPSALRIPASRRVAPRPACA